MSIMLIVVVNIIITIAHSITRLHTYVMLALLLI